MEHTRSVKHRSNVKSESGGSIHRESERPIVAKKSGNSDGAKGER